MPQISRQLIEGFYVKRSYTRVEDDSAVSSCQNGGSCLNAWERATGTKGSYRGIKKATSLTGAPDASGIAGAYKNDQDKSVSHSL